MISFVPDIKHNLYRNIFASYSYICLMALQPAPLMFPDW